MRLTLAQSKPFRFALGAALALCLALGETSIAPAGAPDGVSSGASNGGEPTGIRSQLTLASLDEWRQRIAPDEREAAWTRIPWRDAFWKAVAEAREKPRPILLWAMNGHPLGCT